MNHVVDSIATVEHLMAALQGLGVDNAVIEVDGDEIPVMDGSSARFVDAIDEAGVRTLNAPRRYIRVLRPIRVDKGSQYGELLPHDGFELDITIDFANRLIGRQQLVLEVTPDCFRRELSRARTFGFMNDVEKFWAAGLALGASLDNAIVIKDEKILNQEGLRFVDEFVRHKALDALGDMALAGAPILGKYRSLRGGHKLNNEVLTALLDQPDAWCYENIPARREKTVGGAAVGISLPAYGPDVS
ncbi:MAG: UDP-3-O-acyl-N-acetylglucosamine deacetylase [Fimbriimonadaceae bacterium]|nr:UDP-3-O-acyl-N-acetylglucosamine deacetylase [Alphaproteobacteria bacterium]